MIPAGRILSPGDEPDWLVSWGGVSGECGDTRSRADLGGTSDTRNVSTCCLTDLTGLQLRPAGGTKSWPLPPGIRGCAVFSDDPSGDYRYVLYRCWGENDSSLAVFIGLNPSTAEPRFDDPTVRKCWTWAQSWGFTSFAMLNLFAWRATDQRDLWNGRTVADVTGVENDRHVEACAKKAKLVVATWGDGNTKRRDVSERAWTVRAMLEGITKVHRLPHAPNQLTKRGNPRHPLYLPTAIKLTDLRVLKPDLQTSRSHTR